jgi:hypothetical protein
MDVASGEQLASPVFTSFTVLWIQPAIWTTWQSRSHNWFLEPCSCAGKRALAWRTPATRRLCRSRRSFQARKQRTPSRSSVDVGLRATDAEIRAPADQ